MNWLKKLFSVSSGQDKSKLTTKTHFPPTEGAASFSSQSQKNKELLLATNDGNIAAVSRLLDEGALVNGMNDDGLTALILASLRGHIEIVRHLLEKGADVNSKETSNGLTPLFMSAQENNVEIVKLLLAKGADVNSKTTQGLTALWQAAWKGYPEIVKLLLENGADVNVTRTKDGATPLIRLPREAIRKSSSCYLRRVPMLLLRLLKAIPL